MKKFIISLLTIAITISIAGCGSTTNISNSEIDLPISTSTPESTPTPTPMPLAKEIIGTWEADNGVLWEYKDDGICTLNFSNFNTYDTSTAAEVVRKQLPLSFNYKVDGDYLVFTMGADHYRNHTIIKNDIKYETDSICGETTIMRRIVSRESEKNREYSEKEQYYLNNYYRAKHILVFTEDLETGKKIENAEQKIDEVQARINIVLASGEDIKEAFDDLIEQYSEDPGCAKNPNGYFFKDGEMVKEFENAVKSIGIGEVTTCESEYGYHFVLRLALDETPEIFEEGFKKSGLGA